MPITVDPKNYGSPLAARFDDRRGLGYGQLKQTFHKPHLAASDFPYMSQDEEVDDVDVDDESYEAVNKKVHKFQQSDFGAAKAADRLYFVGAATKLRACFERPDDVLREIHAIGRDAFVPKDYSIRRRGLSAIGGFSSWKAFDQRPYKRTGTKRGWAEAPPLSTIASADEEVDDEFYTLEDLADDHTSSLDESFSFYRHT